MNIGIACAVFEQINDEKYTEQQKLNAIKQVIEMPTHNGITKDCILNAFKWFFDWAVEESSANQTNADRIRSMTDEELAELLVEAENAGYRDDSITPLDKDCCHISMIDWLQSEVEE